MRPFTSTAVIALSCQPSRARSLSTFSSLSPDILPPSIPSRISSTLYSYRAAMALLRPSSSSVVAAQPANPAAPRRAQRSAEHGEGAPGRQPVHAGLDVGLHPVVDLLHVGLVLRSEEHTSELQSRQY